LNVRLVSVAVAVVLVAAGLVVYFNPFGSGNTSTTDIRIGTVFPGTQIAYIQAGIQNGFFSSEGLNITLVNFNSVTLMMSALSSGSVQLGIGGADDVLFYDSGGGNAKIISTYVDRLVYSLIAQANYTTVQSLVGKVATVTSTASADYLAIALVLNSSGLPPTALQYLSGGAFGTAKVALVQKGEAQVAALDPDYAHAAEQAGLRVLANTTALPTHIAYVSVFGMDSYLTANPKTVESFLKGLEATKTWFTSNREAAATVIQSFLDMSSLSQAEAAWDNWAPAFSPSVAPDPSGIRNMISLYSYFNPTLVNVNVHSVIDSSYYNSTIGQ
jgi:NitT/TauT family transport system substrate-binding protein